MFRSPVLLILALILAAVALGALVLAAFPPGVTPVPVERVLPNDRFQTR
jgi:hypothetical protein